MRPDKTVLSRRIKRQSVLYPTRSTGWVLNLPGIGREPVGGQTTEVCDARPVRRAGATVTFPDARHHRLLTGTKLYCLVTELALACEQLAQGCYLEAERPGVEPATFESQVQRPNHYITRQRRRRALCSVNWAVVSFSLSFSTVLISVSCARQSWLPSCS